MTAAAGEVLAHVSLAQVWAALGGGEIRHRRGRAFWRGGDGWNVGIDEEKKVWFDFVAGMGGGLVDLVALALGCDKSAAMLWLAETAGIPLASNAPSNPAAYAAHRNRATLLAQRVADWANGKAAWLDQQKRLALDNGDFSELAIAARALYELERSDAQTLIVEFHADPDAEPREREGRADRLEAERLAEAIVQSISQEVIR
jgi:hypothetical protein